MGAVPVTCVTAREAHVPAIQSIEEQSFPDPWSLEAFLRELQDPLAHYFVALSPEGEVLGYCGYWNVVGEAHITNVAVRPGSRGQGVGTALMRHMLQETERAGIQDATLEVREDNVPALRLYESCGFAVEGMRKNYYRSRGARKHALILWRRGG